MAFQIKTETLTEVIILYERINLNILFKDHFETTFMEKYETEYPGIILVHEDLTQHKLTINDNQQRVLIIETHANLQTLHKVFEKEGFEETILEEKKAYQIGNGFRKNLSDEWDMHIRFIRIHQNMIAIDGEVETSTKWLEHNTGNNWISIIYEISSILKKIPNRIISLAQKDWQICCSDFKANENSDDADWKDSMETRCNSCRCTCCSRHLHLEC